MIDEMGGGLSAVRHGRVGGCHDRPRLVHPRGRASGDETAGLSRIFSKYTRYLGELPHTSGIALRILAVDAVKRRLLGMEAAALERRWEDDEELAAIIDRDLTHIPRLEGARVRIRDR